MGTAAEETSALAARLGVRRAVIPHVDDLGATHGANAAFLGLLRRGLVTCGSVIVPGPWFPEIAAVAAADSALDLGVHLTLTSEWDGLRWAPLTTRSPSSGLVDKDGYFPRSVAELRARLVPEAAAEELQAQVERAVAMGLKPTHLDAHMAAAMVAELLPVHVALGERFGLWPVLPRSILWAPDPGPYREIVAELDRAGRPVADHCRGTLPVEAHELRPGWERLVRDLPIGVTHLALHATTPGDFAAAAPAHAGWRFREWAMLDEGWLQALLRREDVIALGCRNVQALWLETGAKP